MQRTEATDAYVLMQFARKTAHLKGRAVDAALQAEMKKLGAPVVRQLQLNGHSLADAVDLMRRAFYAEGNA